MKINIPDHIWDALLVISDQEGVNPEDAAIGMLTELLESTGALVPVDAGTISVKLPRSKKKLKAQGRSS